MADPLTTALRRHLEALSQDAPHTRLSFIVTLQPDATVSSLAAAGMHIEQQVPDPPLAMGTMTPRQALIVATLPAVLLLEHDAGGVHTLKTST
jgi:hypothetical protein